MRKQDYPIKRLRFHCPTPVFIFGTGEYEGILHYYYQKNRLVVLVQDTPQRCEELRRTIQSCLDQIEHPSVEQQELFKVILDA